jgi:hypothetical protein
VRVLVKRRALLEATKKKYSFDPEDPRAYDYGAYLTESMKFGTMQAICLFKEAQIAQIKMAHIHHDEILRAMGQ